MCCGRRICRWEETGGGLEEEECNELKMRVRKGLLDTAAVENVDKSGGGAYSPLRGGTGEFKSVEINVHLKIRALDLNGNSLHCQRHAIDYLLQTRSSPDSNGKRVLCVCVVCVCVLCVLCVVCVWSVSVCVCGLCLCVCLCVCVCVCLGKQEYPCVS